MADLDYSNRGRLLALSALALLLPIGASAVAQPPDVHRRHVEAGRQFMQQAQDDFEQQRDRQERWLAEQATRQQLRRIEQTCDSGTGTELAELVAANAALVAQTRQLVGEVVALRVETVALRAEVERLTARFAATDDARKGAETIPKQSELAESPGP